MFTPAMSQSNMYISPPFNGAGAGVGTGRLAGNPNRPFGGRAGQGRVGAGSQGAAEAFRARVGGGTRVGAGAR